MTLLGFQGRRGGLSFSPAQVQVIGQANQSVPALGEARTFLDESENHINAANAQDMVDRLAAANWNVVVPFVWHGQGKTWGYDLHGLSPTFSRYSNSSKFSQWDQAHDSLSDLITRCHAVGIEVHPAFTVVLRQNSDIHTEWFTQNNTPPDAYDMRNDFFRDWMMDMIAEVINNYDIDGFYLDYCRTGDGYYNNPAWQAEYAALYPGATMLADRNTLQQAFDPNNPRAVESMDAYRLVNFNEYGPGDIVRRTRALLNAKNPNLVLQNYGGPWKILGSRDQGRVPNKWLEDGLIDVISVASYAVGDTGKPDQTDFSPQALERSFCVKPEAYTPICGNYMTNPSTGKLSRKRTGNEVNAILEQVLSDGATALEPGVGRQLYLFNQYSDEQKNALAAGVFHFPADIYWNRTVGQIINSAVVSVLGQGVGVGEAVPVITDCGRLSKAAGGNHSGTITVPEDSEAILVLLAPIRNQNSTGLAVQTLTYDDVDLDVLQSLQIPNTVVSHCPGVAAYTLLSPSTGANTLALTWTSATASNCSSILIQVYSFKDLHETDPWGDPVYYLQHLAVESSTGVDVTSTQFNSRIVGLGHMVNNEAGVGVAAGDVTNNIVPWQTGTSAGNDSSGLSGVIPATEIKTYRWQADFENTVRNAAIAVEVRGAL